MNILGIHHVTAISSDPNKTVEFYSEILGLRLVKKTVNFDDPVTYHLYFGNEIGQPGTILTFFPWTKLGIKGRIGNGQVITTSFSIPENSVDFWMDRLSKYQIDYELMSERFDEAVISFKDFDGLGIELIANSEDERNAWITKDINEENAIMGFYNVTLSVEAYEYTAKLLTELLGFVEKDNQENRFRFTFEPNIPGNIVDVICNPEILNGAYGIGTVHHVAFRTKDKETQSLLRKQIIKAGFNVTPVMNRNYFESIYFREPGHVLFEIATDPPGFTVDEDKNSLGENLKLPAWLEDSREKIENALPEIKK